MNKLVIIGNGFDLAHGLPTRYNDFMCWYLKEALIAFSKNRTYDDKLIRINFSSQNTKYINFPKFTEDVLNGKMLNEIFNIINSLKTNFEYFNLTFNSDFFQQKIFEKLKEGWVDLEVDYYEYLIEISRRDDADKLIKELNADFDFIKEKLIEYLQTVKGSFTHKIHQTLQLIFELYIQYSGIDDNSKLIINFNYTDTLNIYIDKEGNRLSQYQKINIHGHLDDDESIILGYGNESNAHYQELEKTKGNEKFRHIKSFQYFNTSNYQELSKFIESEEFEVAILGHSCGESDGTLLKEIFEHKNCKSIKIYYKDKNDYNQKTMEISKLFSNYSLPGTKIVPFSECKPLLSEDPQN